MSFPKSFYFSMVIAAAYLSSNSVSAWAIGGGLLSKKWTNVDRRSEGLKTGKNVRISFVDDPQVHAEIFMQPHMLSCSQCFATTKGITILVSRRVIRNRSLQIAHVSSDLVSYSQKPLVSTLTTLIKLLGTRSLQRGS